MEVFIELIQFFAAGHQHLTAFDYLLNAIAGAVGAITAYIAANEGEVFLPRYDAEQHSVELGVLGRALIGAGAGMIVGHSGFAPFAAGVVAPVLLPLFLDKLMKKFGGKGGQ
jgi:hypothetical protein